ncbi:hypothetical protein ACFFMN_10130 [Planobispora siamensis]|uniref:Mce-associated membrane protein n=1 Tax=Planobispora siamensis TaxID=936338 RepID=A0A8J3SKL0_9ACTN|nr:hypothetical protein [Planobispora siamensis]GIH91348.1 hypothetical protein Psi01_19780 [Planobispora siamensis]
MRPARLLPVRRGLPPIAVTLAVVALVLAGVAGFMFADLQRLRSGEEAGRQALEAARSAAPDMLSYDYRTIEQDLARAAGYTTGALTGHYRRLAGSLAPEAKRQRAVQSATVTGAAVESAGPDRVDVLLFVDMSTVRETPGEEPRRQVSQSRARLTMVKTDSRWLVSELSTLLGNPPFMAVLARGGSGVASMATLRVAGSGRFPGSSLRLVREPGGACYVIVSKPCV